jgi:hypothetical protein
MLEAVFFRNFIQKTPTELLLDKNLLTNSRKNIAANVKVFMKKGEFGTRPPVTGAGFCSKVELLPTAS